MSPKPIFFPIEVDSVTAYSMSQYLTPRFYANIYAIIASILALTLLSSYPPLQSPHEAQHYLRGLTFSTLYKNGTLPRSIFQFIRKAERAPDLESDLRLEENMPAGLLPVSAEAVQQELRENVRRPFVSHSNVAVYPFINYVPQIIAGTVGDIFHLKPFTIFYLARVFCLVSGIAFGYLILRLLPSYHVPVMVALLFPSGWIMRIQQYVDQTVIIASFFYLALLIRALAYGGRIGYRHMAMFSIAGLTLSASKIVYFPLTFSILLIPTRQFSSFRQRMICIGAVVSISLLASIFGAIQALHADYGMNIELFSQDESGAIPSIRNPYNAEKWPEKQARLQMILTGPLSAILNVADAYSRLSFWKYQSRDVFIWNHNTYAELLKPLGIWPLLLALSPFFLSLIMAPAGGNQSQATKAYWPSINDRILVFALIVIVAFLVALALYTGSWQGFEGVQGRYLVPLLPFVALLFSLRLPEKWYVYGSVFQLVASLSVLTILYLGILGMA